MPITPLPTPAPSRSQPENDFVANSNALFGALPTLVTEINAESALINADRVAAAASAASAAGQVTLAAAQVALATAEADRAKAAADIASGAANFQGEYSAGTTYQIGQSVSYLGTVFIAKTINLGVTPVDGANWLELGGGAGWVQIGSDVATTSGTSVTFANIPADYADLLFEFVGVSVSASANILMDLSDDGTNYTGTGILFLSSAATNTLYGQVILPRYQGGVIGAYRQLTNITTTRGVGSANNDLRISYRLPGAVTHARFSVASGNFNAGLIRLFGK